MKIYATIESGPRSANSKPVRYFQPYSNFQQLPHTTMEPDLVLICRKEKERRWQIDDIAVFFWIITSLLVTISHNGSRLFSGFAQNDALKLRVIQKQPPSRWHIRWDGVWLHRLGNGGGTNTPVEDSRVVGDPKQSTMAKRGPEILNKNLVAGGYTATISLLDLLFRLSILWGGCLLT